MLGGIKTSHRLGVAGKVGVEGWVVQKRVWCMEGHED